MKSRIISCLVFLFGLLRAQSDTAQVVVPGRLNTEAAMNKPYVILISADGFRYDYAEKYHAENLLNLAREGVRAEAMLPAYPSITGPNHFTIITGRYPSHTGFVDNLFYDKARGDYFAMSKKEKISDGSWLYGTPLWSLAEQQGTLSASLFWVASNSDAGGTRPTYYYNYHENFSEEKKLDILINWLELPAEKRPHFITYYLPQADKAGHFYGPEAKETEAAVQLIDKTVSQLAQRVGALNLPNVNFIFVSDHGMITVDTAKPLQIPELLSDQQKYMVFNAQTLLRVMVKDPRDVMPTFRTLKRNRTEDYKVYLTKRFPKRLHYGAKDDRFQRIGEIMLVPRAPKIFLERGASTKAGKHGYDPQRVPEMKASFYAWGKAFRPAVTVRPFQNVNVYPLVARILNLKITTPIDGKPSLLHKILK